MRRKTEHRTTAYVGRAVLAALVAGMLAGSTVTFAASGTAGASSESTAASPSAEAAGIYVSTMYPGVTAKAGSKLSFSLNIDNAEDKPTDLALSVKSIPDGWSGYFEGNGNEISSVHAAVGQTADAATFYAEVPKDAKAGDYDLTITAGDEDLALKVTVSDEEKTADSLTTEYAEQEGATGTTFTFTSTIQNNSSESQNYSFSNSAPDGWTVSVTPSGETTKVASVDVDAQSSKALSITVTPPEKVDAGDYEIPFSAISASETLKTTLKVTITGTYDLSLSTPSSTLSFNAVANKKKAVTLTLANNGNIDLSNINLTADSTPTDWTVDFSESTIDTLAAGQSKEITLYVTLPRHREDLHRMGRRRHHPDRRRGRLPCLHHPQIREALIYDGNHHPYRQSDEAVRRRHGGGRPEPEGPQRRGLRTAGAERRGQDHDDADASGPHGADLGSGVYRRDGLHERSDQREADRRLSAGQRRLLPGYDGL